ncbi:hypothetical protein COV17_03640 [Candidatus Woesearchaeota archaeon CG10_big_fil_rev_8_21_14_0_10_36_11]|nr:MAG: hypothetical protein COV17_03640 [Candidatus Woesearchaeota archaeon CG10_big_fil_rev_8_21_14_0_10_36_11]
MKTLTTFLERIAERGLSFVLHGSRLYDFVDTEKYPDNVRVGGFHQSLVPSLSFSHLERFDVDMQVRPIHTHCTGYVKDTVNAELKAEEELLSEKGRIHTLEFIMYELLPLIVSKKYGADSSIYHDEINAALDDLEGGTGKTSGVEIQQDRFVQTAKEEIRAQLAQDFGTDDTVEENPSERLRAIVLQREKQSLSRDPLVPLLYTPEEIGIVEDGISSSLFGEITGNQALYVINGNVFQLVIRDQHDDGADSVDSELVFTVNGREYVPGKKVTDIATLSSEYKQRRVKLWRIAALEKSKDAFDIIRNIVREDGVTQRQMHELAKREEYDISGSGFILREGHYYVYTTVNKFATQDGRNGDVFWPFPTTRVAIQVGSNGGVHYVTREVYVVEQREHHPCIRERMRPSGFGSLCNLKDSNYGKTPAEMVRRLNAGVNVVREPLNQISLDKHPGYTYFYVHLDDILTQGSLTRADARAQGYDVIEVLEKKVT